MVAEPGLTMLDTAVQSGSSVTRRARGREFPSVYLSAVVFILSAVVLYSCGEKLPLTMTTKNFDANIYESVARDPLVLFDRWHPAGRPFHFYRSLPSLAVHVFLRVFQCPLTHKYVERGFTCLNLFWLSVAILAYIRISQFLRWSVLAAHVGLAMLFCNFMVLKFWGFYPILTDQTAYALAILALWAWLERKPWVLWFLMIAGFFAHPLVGPMALVLFGVPRRIACRGNQLNGVTPSDWSRKQETENNSHRIAVEMLAVSVAVTIVLIQTWVVVGIVGLRQPSSLREFLLLRTIVAVSFVGLYMYYIARTSFRVVLSHCRMRETLETILSRRLLIAAVTLVMIKLVYPCCQLFSSNDLPVQPTSLSGEMARTASDDILRGYPPRNYLVFCGRVLYFSSFNKGRLPMPALFAAAHGVFWGPLSLVPVFVLRCTMSQAYRQGVAMFMLTLGASVLLLYSESRSIAPLVPFLVVPFCGWLSSRIREISDGKVCSVRRRMWILAAVYGVAVCSSFVWVQFIVEGEFQRRLYVGFLGPWMGTRAYIGALFVSMALVMLCIGAWYMFAMRYNQRPNSTCRWV